jgi:phenylacetate-coenzyme A ligase PaaK-like adenylate-forming protein
VLNTLSYHLTPGGFIADSGARALGCPVIPAGPGNTEQQLDLIEAFRPIGYVGVPDFVNFTPINQTMKSVPCRVHQSDTNVRFPPDSGGSRATRS